jgi:hypothetical protein
MNIGMFWQSFDERKPTPTAVYAFHNPDVMAAGVDDLSRFLMDGKPHHICVSSVSCYLFPRFPSICAFEESSVGTYQDSFRVSRKNSHRVEMMPTVEKSFLSYITAIYPRSHKLQA